LCLTGLFRKPFTVFLTVLNMSFFLYEKKTVISFILCFVCLWVSGNLFSQLEYWRHNYDVFFC
jgi:hypothetical protein